MALQSVLEMALSLALRPQSKGYTGGYFQNTFMV